MNATAGNQQPKLPKYAVTAISELIPYASNSRTHSEAQIAQIAASMREFGWMQPIVTDGSRGILAGHGRVMAARLLGWTMVPTIDGSHLTPAQRKAYVIADNKLAENAGWDKEMLALEFEALREFDYELELTGFGLDEIESLAAGGDSVSLNVGGDESSSGASVDQMRWGKQKVEISPEEKSRLDDALEQYLDAYGGTSGFVTWLVEGSADA